MRSLLTATVTLLALLSALSCASDSAERNRMRSAQREQPRAPSVGDSLVALALQAAGSSLLDSATVSYRFRQNLMGYDRRGGQFVYTRSRTDSTGATTIDVLTNVGVSRTRNNKPVPLSPKQELSAAEGVNSITYFAFLPRALADEAARKEYEGVDTIRGRAYHRIRVGFDAEGGGRDFDDDFLYWFDAEDFSLDFLAYAYATNGGGVRFREAFNSRLVRGVTVQDYRNFSAEPENSLALEEMLGAWQRGELTLLSVVALEEVQVL